MKQIKLPKTDLNISRFSLGTASLHHVGNIEKQVSFLKHAYDLGFTHFDTAPLYGYGLAEKSLGLAFAGNLRSKVTLSSKIGLYPPGGANQSYHVMRARKAIGKIIPTLSSVQKNFSLRLAVKSFEATLKRLRTDRLDILFIHDPIYQMLDEEAFLRWFETEQSRGRIGYIGVCGIREYVEPFLEFDSNLALCVQTQDSIDRKEADFVNDYNRPMQFTYGYNSAKSQKKPIYHNVMTQALQRNEEGSILVSTTKIKRLKQFIHVSESFDR